MTVQSIDNLFAAMDASKGIPALEATVSAILTTLLDKSKGCRDFANHVIEDFSLTQKVLKLANSAMYAPFAQNSNNVTSAISILGSDALLHIVLSTSIASEDEVDRDKNLSETLLAAEFARNLSATRVEEVSIAALMYDLGRLLVGKFLPEECAVVERKIAAGVPSDAASTSVLGLTLQQIGVEVAKRWRFPPNIIAVIDGTGDPVLVDIARFSRAAASLVHEGKVREVHELIATLDVPGVDKSKLCVLINHRAERFISRSKDIHVLKSVDALNELHVALAEEKKKTVESLAGAMFYAFGDLLGTAHCLLFTLARSGDFCVKHGVGKGIDELRSKLRISADFKPTLFHASIKNNVDVSISDVSKLRAAALPGNYRALLPTVNKFLILPIANSHVTGLVYCDWETDNELSADELRVVKQLRDLFLPFFPR